MKANEIKYMLTNDPVYALNAIIDNNPTAVSIRLNSIGISVGEDKEAIFSALEGLSQSGDYESFHYALNVPVDIVNLNHSGRSAVYGDDYAHSYQAGTLMTPFAVTAPVQNFLLPGPQTVDELLEDLENMDGPPSEEPEDAGFNWGALVGPLMTNIFGLFGNNPQNEGGGGGVTGMEAYLLAEQSRRESTRKTITWVIIGVISLAVVYLVYKSARAN
jgi:hypothetical protein